MRRYKRRLIGLAAAVATLGAVGAPAAGAMPYSERAGDHAASAPAPYSERAGDRPAPSVEVTGDAQCAAWAETMRSGLALYGIHGGQADSYLASRADNPCATPLTLRSLFHAGD